jgi:hypothetical protein
VTAATVTAGPVPAAVATTDPGEGPGADAPSAPRHRLRELAVSGALYLALSVVVWWHVWTTHPSTVTTCGCGDSSLFTWFLAWPAHALAHGLDPFYSTAMFHPHGVNLLANTSEVGLGVALAPVTWLFGPVATLNVALTLSPVLSALAMFVLVRRWVAWAPAAFVAGLAYGFSSLVLVSLTDAHLMIGFLAVPPLVVACLDELLVRQRHRPARVGVVLGLLVVVQFFVGTELLAIMAVVGAVMLGGLLVWAALRHPDELRRRARPALTGLATGTGVAVVLLAWPAWFALAGPAHLSGPIWQRIELGYGGVSLKGYVWPTPAAASFNALTARLGGYQGPTLSGQYLGIGLVAVAVAGTAVWRRDRRLWFFGLTALVTVPLSLAVNVGIWVPWRALRHVPLIENIIPSRFVSMTFLALAVMLGVVVDRSRTATARRPGGTRAAGTAVGAVVALVALVPVGAYLSASTPMTVRTVTLPAWFATEAPALPAGQVVLAYPVPFSGVQGVLTWQAVGGMHWAVVGGAGPGSIPSRQGDDAEGLRVIAVSSAQSLTAADTTPEEVAAVRRAMDDAGVTTVVVPDQPGLPRYDQVTDAASAVGLMTAATGRAPVRQAGAWVWSDVRSAGPPLTVPTTEFQACIAGPYGVPVPADGVPACLLSAAGTGS